MRFILFVEGPSERRTLPGFLKRWLDPKLAREKCPRLREMLDEMLGMAKVAGL